MTSADGAIAGAFGADASAGNGAVEASVQAAIQRMPKHPARRCLISWDSLKRVRATTRLAWHCEQCGSLVALRRRLSTGLPLSLNLRLSNRATTRKWTQQTATRSHRAWMRS